MTQAAPKPCNSCHQNPAKPFFDLCDRCQRKAARSGARRRRDMPGQKLFAFMLGCK